MTEVVAKRGLPFERWRSRLLWATVLLVLGMVLWFRAHFELVRIPSGMDTMPRTHPPGALCLVVKRPAQVAVKDVVFVDLPEGGTLLARVESVGPQGLHVRAANERSVLTGGHLVGPIAPAAVRGRVVTVFGGEPDPDAK